MKVFVLTNAELGWDCVVGVYSTYDKAFDHATQYTRETWDEEEDGIMTKETLRDKWEDDSCMSIFEKKVQ